MDLELLDWLKTHTFPEEAKYADLEYARKAYGIFVQDLARSATTRACIFATVHVEATEILMELLEETGLKTMVGKVNMDRNCPDGLREENGEISAIDTIRWLEESRGKYKNTACILTPRFLPACSDELMERLERIQKEYRLPLQSHLSENTGEIAWVKELCPDASGYGAAYDRTGALGGEFPAVMAHCVWSDDEEQNLLKARGTFVAHCPQSNVNLASGIASVRQFLDKGISVGLGSDVAAGTSKSIFRAMADAVSVSKLRWRLVDHSLKPLTVEEAFYLGTKGGGAFFGKTGSFEEGYEMDALVLEDTGISSPRPLNIKERLERFVYLGDESMIKAKYVEGKPLF